MRNQQTNQTANRLGNHTGSPPLTGVVCGPRTASRGRAYAPVPVACVLPVPDVLPGLLASHEHREEHQNGKHLSEFPRSAVGRARKTP